MCCLTPLYAWWYHPVHWNTCFRSNFAQAFYERTDATGLGSTHPIHSNQCICIHVHVLDTGYDDHGTDTPTGLRKAVPGGVFPVTRERDNTYTR